MDGRRLPMPTSMLIASRAEARALLITTAMLAIGLCGGLLVAATDSFLWIVFFGVALVGMARQERLADAAAARLAPEASGVRLWLTQARVGQELTRPRTVRYAWRLVREP